MPSDNDILTSIAMEVARVEAEIRARESELEGLRRAEETIRIARGTPMPAPAVAVLTANLERRARPRTTVPTPVAHAPNMIARVREILEQRSAKTLELAGTIGTTAQLMQDALDALHESGEVFRFDDGAYTWKVGNASADALTAAIKRYMLERHVSRRDLMRAIGVEDKLLEKRVDNQLDHVRETEPVWGQKDAEGHWLYWIIPGQKPPRELDGRKTKRVRSRTNARAPSDGAQAHARRGTRTSPPRARR